MTVIGIRSGVEIRAPGEPDPLVIAELERVLEMARSGELAGFAMALQWQDKCHSYIISGCRNYGMIGTLEEAKFRLLREFEPAP